MHVEIVKTPSGRELVEIELGGDVIHSLTKEDALKIAGWIIELCQKSPASGGIASPGSRYVVSSPCMTTIEQGSKNCTCSAYQLENYGCKCGAKSE